MLTDNEIAELEQLLEEQRLYDLRQGLRDPNEKTSVNYKFLQKSLLDQRYEDGTLVSGYRGVILEGSSRCFHSGQEVLTNVGPKKISEIKKGDLVLTPKGYKTVTDTHKMRNSKPCVRIKLKSGKIIVCTEDHEFFFKGVWVSIKHILSLVNQKDGDTLWMDV